MTQKNNADCFGFLTVRFNESVGYFGGLLTVNSVGRPLEFHCSLPIKPSRAQTILYGDSLSDFLIGEQISLAIVSKVKQAPSTILTDLTAALTLRHVHSVPIACLENAGSEQTSRDGNTLAITDVTDSTTRGPNLIKPLGFPRSTHRFRLANTTVSTLEEYKADEAQFVSIWENLKPQINPAEPFSRIVEALMEANPLTKAA